METAIQSINQSQQTALSIIRSANIIATPEQLALVISDQSVPKFHQLPAKARVSWLGEQLTALNYMAHSTKAQSEIDLLVEATMLDQMLLDDPGARVLTQVEMQEAFRRGITGAYGEYYGITAKSLFGFIGGFRSSEKRQKALAIIYRQQQEENMAKEQRFWKELAKARQERGFELPDFKARPLDTRESSEEHRRKIAAQREAILNEANKKA